MPLRRSSRPPRTAGQTPRGPRFAAREGWIAGCRKDPQTVHADWLPVQVTIDGVKVREVRHLTKRYGLLTEIFRFDARTSSPTHGTVNEFRFGDHRPALLVVPPGVWHGVQNLRPAQSRVLNVVDQAYSYADPDHWRLLADSPHIPFRFDDPRGS